MDGPGRDPRGHLIRPYTFTRGRTEPTREVAIEAVLVTTQRGRQEAPFAGRDKHLICDLCDRQPQSLAEVAARTRMPLGVARVLVAEMVAEDMLTLHDTTIDDSYTEHMDLLEKVLDGLRKL